VGFLSGKIWAPLVMRGENKHNQSLLWGIIIAQQGKEKRRGEKGEGMTIVV